MTKTEGQVRCGGTQGPPGGTQQGGSGLREQALEPARLGSGLVLLWTVLPSLAITSLAVSGQWMLAS